VDRAVSFGLSLYTGQHTGLGGARYQDVAPIAVAAEEAGFDVFWISEHHDFDDGYLPSPFVALGAAAAVTTSITLATGVALGPLAHPLRLAEDAVVVDHLSQGRLLLGLGIGYAPGEYRMFGVPMSRRGPRMTETVEILRRAWTGERFSYRGEIFTFDEVRVRPASVRAGGIPIWLGGYAKPAVLRAARLADGHLVGRGSPDLVHGAARYLEEILDPADPSFTFAMNLAVVGDEPSAEGASARTAFARQQRSYERVQTDTDVYADRLTISAGPELDLGEIEAYFQVLGDTAALIGGITDTLAANSRWSRLHVALRAFFPDEELEKVLRRVRYLGETVLPGVRRAFVANPRTTNEHRGAT